MRIKNYLMAFIVITSFTLIASCDADNGIAPKPFIPPPPPDSTTGFSGRITFFGTWSDSIQRIHIVMTKDLLTGSNFNITNLKFISSEIPFGVEYYDYSSSDSSLWPLDGIIEPGEYAYIAVAQQSTPEITIIREDWFVAGVYYAEGDTSQPGTLSIPANTLVRDINIICDFENPPPQPPGGN